jgi:gamma-glutamylcyclotransferase (GGCT)/AIG2-like uncharacterized protein YtfP
MTNNSDWLTLFVYGALKEGCQRSDILSTAVDQGLAEYKYMGQTTKDYDLLDFGTFPGLIYGNQYIGGEIYSVSPETLKVMDEYENHPNLFIRKEISLFAADYLGEISKTAQAYFFNLDEDHGLLLNVLRSDHPDRESYIKNVSKNLKIWSETWP